MTPRSKSQNQKGVEPQDQKEDERNQIERKHKWLSDWKVYLSPELHWWNRESSSSSCDSHTKPDSDTKAAKVTPWACANLAPNLTYLTQYIRLIGGHSPNLKASGPQWYPETSSSDRAAQGRRLASPGVSPDTFGSTAKEVLVISNLNWPNTH